MSSVVQKKYWGKHWQETEFGIAPAHHPIRQFIELDIKPAKDNQKCLEIGCYPGKFLAVFGEKGYQLSGIDMFKGTKISLSNWLKSRGYKVGDFYQLDFLKFDTKNLYDIVCSFGFIEHFSNWPNVIKRHVDLTRKNGLVVIDVPNLKSPLYYLLYRLFEPEVLKNHELPSLNMNAICKVFMNNKCQIKSARYVGYFYFRFITKNSKLSKKIEKLINLLRPVFEFLPESVYKRYIVVVAIKSVKSQ